MTSLRTRTSLIQDNEEFLNDYFYDPKEAHDRAFNDGWIDRYEHNTPFNIKMSAGYKAGWMTAHEVLAAEECPAASFTELVEEALS